MQVECVVVFFIYKLGGSKMDSQTEALHTAKRIAISLISIVGVLFVLVLVVKGINKNSLPEGKSNTDDILTYMADHKNVDEQISMTSAMSQIQYGMGGNDEGLDSAKYDESIYIMKNTDTGRYVFKYGEHNVYLVKELTDFYSNGDYKYIYFVVGIKPDESGEVYLKQPDANKYDDSNAEESTGYSINDYNNYYASNDDD